MCLIDLINERHKIKKKKKGVGLETFERRVVYAVFVPTARSVIQQKPSEMISRAWSTFPSSSALRASEFLALISKRCTPLNRWTRERWRKILPTLRCLDRNREHVHSWIRPKKHRTFVTKFNILKLCKEICGANSRKVQISRYQSRRTLGN